MSSLTTPAANQAREILVDESPHLLRKTDELVVDGTARWEFEGVGEIILWAIPVEPDCLNRDPGIPIMSVFYFESNFKVEVPYFLSDNEDLI